MRHSPLKHLFSPLAPANAGRADSMKQPTDQWIHDLHDLRARVPLSQMTEPELCDYFHCLARVIEVLLPPSEEGQVHERDRFILLVADEPGVARYVSYGRREDCMKWMQETIERWQKNEEIPR